MGVGWHGSPSVGSACSLRCFQDHTSPSTHFIRNPVHYFTRNQWWIIVTVAIHHLLPRRPPVLTVPRSLFSSEEAELQPELSHTLGSMSFPALCLPEHPRPAGRPRTVGQAGGQVRAHMVTV